MAFDNTNRGALFSNADKKTNEKHPDYKGKLNVGGVDFEIAGWMKTAKDTGIKYMSLSVQPKREA